MAGPITNHPQVIAVDTKGVATIRGRSGGPDTRKLDPINDRMEIVRKHAQSSRDFSQSEVDAQMLGSRSGYGQWFDSGKKGPNPSFSIDVDSVVKAINALSPDEVRELRKELSIMSEGQYCCPVDYVAARDAAKRRLIEYPTAIRIKIVIEHATALRVCARDELDSDMVGSTGRYKQWFQGDRNPKNRPFFTDDPEVVVSAIRALTPEEVRAQQIHLVSILHDPVPGYESVAVAAKEKLGSIIGKS